MYTSVVIGNVTDREKGKKKIKQLNEITKSSFYNIEYGVCPIGGSCDIVATSNYEFEGDGEKELLEYLVYALFRNI